MPNIDPKTTRRPSLSDVVALVALASSTVALAFALWPGIQPDPHREFHARVEVLDVEPGVTLDEYLHRISFTPAEYRANLAERLRATHADRASKTGLLRMPGQLAYVASTLRGFKHRSVVLRWSLYLAARERRIATPGFSEVRVAEVALDAPSDRSMQQVWLPPPPTRRQVFVRFALYDERGTLLDMADSRPFGGIS